MLSDVRVHFPITAVQELAFLRAIGDAVVTTKIALLIFIENAVAAIKRHNGGYRSSRLLLHRTSGIAVRFSDAVREGLLGNGRASSLKSKDCSNEKQCRSGRA
ncbi:hypothetical protein A3C37_00950 [Candidatus Peribacteria bacterium RIFCSPHIGHO2_02_FULL_53_20]|nr:MAG: hypothetical protein A3C37_00950 [Candidatus Peribacteria bacterium RIFCSPHIGHO2_02_FULL_53_20]OGJ65764.1 MAG: hypothetical protein A3B61_00795 [Candidatus Peribacteria bacterium RIFCSPLOWO2_01_FULL_53_10]OGJ69768.1 MAG: hypothetical protein A3G69_03720 [Candidatus Peribacteria bacterium RIFCSPLOWO2_12_FULL_53_10]